MSNRDRGFDSDDDRINLDDPLGIAQEPVTPEGTIRASNDEESVRRRRKRALGEDVEVRTGLDELDGDPGVAGIDMGAGGSGTDIKSSR
jgi:hypothetical protein